jgi:hypothetical protein
MHKREPQNQLWPVTSSNIHVLQCIHHARRSSIRSGSSKIAWLKVAWFKHAPVTNTPMMGKEEIMASGGSSQVFFLWQHKPSFASLINSGAPKLITPCSDSFNALVMLNFSTLDESFVQLMCPTFRTMLATCFPVSFRRMILITDLNFPFPWSPPSTTSILFKLTRSAPLSVAILHSST